MKSFTVLPLLPDYAQAFKQADIHGVYGVEINEGLAFRVGYAFTVLYHLRDIVVDAGNGMGALLRPILQSYKNVTCTLLFFALDGTFPYRGSNPTLPKNQKLIIAEIRRQRYDFGVAFDGDADRIAFFDERGRSVNAAAIGAPLVDYFIGENPTRSFTHTVLTSRIFKETIVQSGATLFQARVGHSYIKEQMRKHGVFFACEHYAHFYYQANY